jgi:hypothetical protein
MPSKLHHFFIKCSWNCRLFQDKHQPTEFAFPIRIIEFSNITRLTLIFDVVYDDDDLNIMNRKRLSRRV